MAGEDGSTPVNGYGHSGYGDSEYGHQASAPTSTAGLCKDEIAWYFVELYYTTMSKQPERLHMFYNKRSQSVSGVEEEKSPLAFGLKAIKEQIAGLDFHDCKVRVTNVDTQGSDSNIVVQVLGELSNKSQPHRKFAQTFVLATQANGFFVLNNIFRYIKDDEDEEEGVAETIEAAADTTMGGMQEPPPTTADSGVATDSKETVATEEDAMVVDEKLEEVAAKDEPPTAAINGASASTYEPLAKETPAPAVSDPAKEPESEPATAPSETSEEFEPEKPKDPVPSPAPSQPAKPAAPPKAAVPKSWANVAKTNAMPASAPPAQPAPTSAARPKQAPAPTGPAGPTPSAPAGPTPAARAPSPESNKEGSSDGWQTAGNPHDRKQPRPQPAPVANQDGRVRAYVKNVGPGVETEALKQTLGKYGEIVYIDIARQKNAAFVEYKTIASFNAAVAANPHKIGTDELYVEERRPPGGNFNRGGRGGRGGSFDAGRGRGGFGGRGRGTGNATQRGGRGGTQGA